MPPAQGIIGTMRHRRLPRSDLPHHTYYLTCCLHNRRPLLRTDELAEQLIALYADRRDQRAILLHGYVVMLDHYHLLLTLREEPSVSGVVRKVHSLFAAHCHRRVGLRGRIWQRRFYDHVVRDDADWHTKLVYMHGSPVRAGLVNVATDYTWSSAIFWETRTGPVACDAIAW